VLSACSAGLLLLFVAIGETVFSSAFLLMGTNTPQITPLVPFVPHLLEVTVCLVLLIN
jgi:hypothetical protein